MPKPRASEESGDLRVRTTQQAATTMTAGEEEGDTQEDACTYEREHAISTSHDRTLATY